MSETAEGVALRPVTIADLATILGEIGEFWEDPGMEFLHQALYVHEFGETSVVAVRDDGAILGYLLGFVSPGGTGYIHAVAVRREARKGGLAQTLYERFAELVGARGASSLKAITRPSNEGSRSFHEALGFSVTLVADYSPTHGTRLVFRRVLGPGQTDPQASRGDLPR